MSTSQEDLGSDGPPLSDSDALGDPENKEKESLYLDGAIRIKQFTWNNLEECLTEVTSRTLRSGRYLYNTIGSLPVVAVACNNLACSKGLPYQFRWSLVYPQQEVQHLPYAAELYVARKEWSDAEKAAWSTDTAMRRQHMCSLEGAWDWKGKGVLRVIFSYPEKHVDDDRLMSGYTVRVRPNIWFYNLRATHYVLQIQVSKRLGDSQAVLLVEPGQFHTKSSKHGWKLEVKVPESQRYPTAENLVHALIAAFGESVSGGKGLVEDWMQIREKRVLGEYRGTVFDVLNLIPPDDKQ